MPISEKQKKILAFSYSDYDAIICHGSVRSGKTSIGFVSFVDWAMRCFNGQRLGVCGVTVGSAIANIIDPYTAMSYSNKRYHIRFSRSTKLMTVERNGVKNTFEIFGGKDEASFKLIQGRTLAGVFLDEVALMPQSFVNQAISRCSVDGSKLWFMCNPDSPRHWFYLDWILKPKEHNAFILHLELDDNPSLSEDIKKRYRNQFHGVFYDRYIRGLWVVAEGLVYQFDSPDEYTCTHDEALNGGGEWFVSIDYGITNPFAALLWRVTPQCAYIVDEYYFSSKEQDRRRTDEEHYDAVHKFIGDKPVIDMVVDPSANSFKEVIWRHGRYDAIDADNSVLDGIQTVDMMLHDGTIKISETCTNLLSEMQLYRWDDKAAKDAVIKENDHCITGDTLIATENGDVPISELVGAIGKVWSYNGSKAVLKLFNDVRMTRSAAEVYEITTDDGRTLKCTAEHKIMTERGWVECRYLMPFDRIISL